MPPRAVTPAQRWRLDLDEAVGGQGCPAPDAQRRAVGGGALDVDDGCRQLISDVQALIHRLPATWARVEALEVPAWRARRLAQATSGLNAAAAAAVDAQLVGQMHRSGPVLIDRAVVAGGDRRHR